MKHYLYPGVDVRLRVDGIDLAEYDLDDLDDDDPNTITKFVEAVAGANFAVRFSATPESARHRDDTVNMKVYLDGKSMVSKVYTISAARGRNEVAYDHIVEGIETNTANGRLLERFAFAELQTTDAPIKAAKQKLEEFKHLGQISVKCIWTRNTGDDHNKQNELPGHKAAFQSDVPEKCLKGRAISNHTILRAPEARAGRVNYVNVTFPYGEVPFAVFNFNYRSRKDLQIEGVIPRSPSPVPLEDRGPDELSPGEMRELLRRMREREVSLVRVKQEGERRPKRARSTTITDGVEDEDDGLEVIAGPSKRRHTSDDSGVEFVDLTDD